MALNGEVKKDGEKESFVATFTNGTFEQLKELSQFLKNEGIVNTSDPIDVIKVSIGFLLVAKENKENGKEQE